MNRIQTIATVLLAAGLALGATACGDEEEGGSIACGADMRLEVGPATCDFAANQVECYYWTEVDDGYELEVVGCVGENSSCEFEFLIALYEGDPVDGEIGLADGSQDWEAEGDLVPDSWELELGESKLSLSFAGAIEETSIEVVGCIDDLPFIAESMEEDDDEEDSDCTSDSGDGHFYCEEITDEDVCSYVAELCDEYDVSDDECCAWDADAGNCGAAAYNLPCEMIDEEDVCNDIPGECIWDD
jgi:hypothetical protein